MEAQDEVLIAEVAKQDDVLRTLWEEHQKFEEALATLNGKPYLTPEDALERKRLQKCKLVGKDKIEAILKQHR